MKTLLFIGHPGHELLAHKFLSVYKPDVVFLTNGSGGVNKSRVHSSIRLIESLGLKAHFPFEPYTDRQIYNLIQSNTVAEFLKLKLTLKNFIIKNNYKIIVGDALEGFNPSHDLCRYLINSIITELGTNHKIDNYEFFQEDISQNISGIRNEDDIIIKLNDNDFEEKVKAYTEYSEIKFEVDKFLALYDKELFTLEYFRKVTDSKNIIGWKTETPYYEEFGKKRVKDGLYKELITFEDHMKVLANNLYL